MNIIELSNRITKLETTVADQEKEIERLRDHVAKLYDSLREQGNAPVNVQVNTGDGQGNQGGGINNPTNK